MGDDVGEDLVSRQIVRWLLVDEMSDILLFYLPEMLVINFHLMSAPLSWFKH